jgi:hypothetical protein
MTERELLNILDNCPTRADVIERAILMLESAPLEHMRKVLSAFYQRAYEDGCPGPDD